MKLLPYKSYKMAGFSWLEIIPDQWNYTKIKHVASFTTGWTPPTGNHESFEGENLWANISDLGPRIIEDTSKRVSDEAIAATNISVSPKGSLLFSFKLSIGQVSFAGVDLYTNEAIATFLPNNEADLNYLYYAAPIYIVENTSYNIYGAKLLNQELIKAAPIALPPKPIQRAITNFLDRETAKLDTLISKQETLIKLLQEKRQAIISHAVTKGLDPDVQMKDSGIDWLGKVPANWTIVPLKRDIKFLTSGSRGWAQYYSDDGHFFIRIGNLTRNSIKIDFDDYQMVSIPEGTEGERTKVIPGDVLFSITAYLGSVAVIPDNFETAYVSQHVALARLNHKYFQSCWVGYVTMSFVGKTCLEMQGYGGTKIQLSLGDIASVLMTAPPIEEQIQIISYIETETTKIDILISKARQSIELAKEHRSALISAAVTGKIDVREAA